MNQLQNIFNYQGHQVRTVVKNGEPWFVAKDVCEVFGDTNYRRSTARLDVDEKGVSPLNTHGGIQEITVVNEAGLYSLLFHMQPQKKATMTDEEYEERVSKLKQFKRWITHEVIPSIRKHGAYMTPDTLEKALTSPDFLIQLATKLKEEQQARIAAETKLEEQKPLVGFAETCLASEHSILIRELAKVASKHEIVIGEKRLYQKLREWGLIMQGKTEPMQKSIDAGYFEVVQGGKETSSGSIIFRTTRVTPKGQVYIINRLKREFFGDKAVSV